MDINAMIEKQSWYSISERAKLGRENNLKGR